MTEHEQHYCRECNAELIENDNWSPSRASTKNYICKSCNTKKTQEWRKQNPDKHRGHKLKSRYGIDAAEWKQMFDAQGGRCAICGSEEPKGRNGVFHVDHCHETGAVRALLCHNCNHGLGYFQDNTETLKNAIEYLEAHRDRMKELSK